MQELELETIPIEALFKRVQDLRRQNYRLVQISATRMAEGFELTYSFDLDRRLVNLRLNVATTTRVPSISSVFWCAFLYENEIHDLFGLQVDGISVDFHGKLYQTSVQFPFGTTKAPAGTSAVMPVSAAKTEPPKTLAPAESR